MKKFMVIISSLAIVVGAALTVQYFLNRQSATEQNKTTVQPSTPAVAQTTSSEPGKYTDYSPTIVANTKGVKILFFHAPWCPQCRALDEDIKKASLPTGVTIIKTDYDANQSLRQQYGVTLQTTFVKVADDGSLIKKYVAYNDPSYANIKTNLLDQ